MKTLQNIKEDVAKTIGYKSWEDYRNNNIISERTLERVSKLYAEQALDLAAQNAGLLETTAYSNSKQIVCVNHKSIVDSMPGIVKTIRVDQGTILIIKDQLK